MCGRCSGFKDTESKCALFQAQELEGLSSPIGPFECAIYWGEFQSSEVMHLVPWASA